ncbi:MAG TPA: NAD-dependent epimerase/dehydratase family protein [Flavipsychrobacter sp.]
MKILITGASGFIGTNLTAYLKAHYPVVEFVCIVRKKTGKPGEVLWEDLSQKHFEDINAVIHLAGLAHDTKNTQDDSAYFKVNFELTRLLYDYYLNSGAKKFIYVSSVKAAADSVEGILTEDVQPTPVTAYGKSKLQAEDYIRQLSLGVESKSYYILRPCMVHGPGNKGNLNLLYQFATKGLPYPLGAFDNSRSFLSVENFCFICRELLTRDIESGIYNLADDEPMSVKELFRVIGATIGRKTPVLNIPRSFVSAMAGIGNTLKLPLNTERLNKLTENYVVSNAKIKKALGVSALPVSVTDGIRRTIASFNSK